MSLSLNSTFFRTVSEDKEKVSNDEENKEVMKKVARTRECGITLLRNGRYIYMHILTSRRFELGFYHLIFLDTIRCIAILN